MKHFIIFLILLLSFVGIYNFTPLQDSFFGFLSDISYQKENLLDAKKGFTNILNAHSLKNLLEADILYNLGNTLYRLGEKETEIERIKLWKESVGNYTKSLSIRTDKDTEENLTFVKEKLQKEEKEQQKKEEEKKKQQEENTGSGAETKNDVGKKEGQGEKTGTGTESEKKDAGTKGTGDEKNNSQPGKSWSNGGSYNPIGGPSKDDANSNLSDADKQEVKKYLEELKQFEKQNGKLLNPEKGGGIGSISDQIRNFFGNDSFFQDVLPTNDGKKDW